MIIIDLSDGTIVEKKKKIRLYSVIQVEQEILIYSICGIFIFYFLVYLFFILFFQLQDSRCFMKSGLFIEI